VRLLLSLAFYVIALGAYVGSGRIADGRGVLLAESALDRSIPFDARFGLVYLAYFPFLLWVLVRLSGRDGFGRLLCSAGAVAAASLLVFLLAPTHVARPAATGQGLGDAVVAWIQRVDPPSNALPSLHASLMVLASAAAVRRGILPGPVALGACAVVLYSALAIKQHGVLDLGAGALLGGVAVGLEPLAQRMRAERSTA
jgi:membrane-associated phospholipid phosphatase